MYPNDYKIEMDNNDVTDVVEIIIAGKEKADKLYDFLKSLYSSESFLVLKMYKLGWYEETLVKEFSIRE